MRVKLRTNWTWGCVQTYLDELVTASQMNDPQRVDALSLEKASIEARAFIGYAVIDLTVDPWKTMEAGPWNRRPVNEMEAGKLEASLKDEGILRVRHPMILAISRGDLEAETYIETAPGVAPLPNLGLKGGARALLLAGQHRRAALANYRKEVETAIRNLSHDHTLLSKLPADADEGMRRGLTFETDPAPSSVGEVEERLAGAQRLCEGLKKWNVRIYDKGEWHHIMRMGEGD
jgi:hypothetical protein